MRLFLAIELPAEIKERLYGLQKEILSLGFFRGTPVKKEQLHLTLHFFGEVGEEKYKDIVEKLKALKFSSFEVRIQRLGVFPSNNYFRVVWAGIEGAGLEKLQRDVCALLGVKNEEFIGHITLFRVKNIINKNSFLDFLEKHREVRFGSFVLKEVILFESLLKPNGPEYFVREKVLSVAE